MGVPVPDRDEIAAGSWFVYLGEPTPLGAKVTGRLSVTNLYVRFQGSLALAAGAGAALSHRLQAFHPTTTSFAVPYQRIASAYVSRRWLILKTLNLQLADGFVIPIHFGAMSPAAALSAIRRGLRRQGKALPGDPAGA